MNRQAEAASLPAGVFPAGGVGRGVMVRGLLAATQRFDAEGWAALWALDALNDAGDTNRIGLVTPFLRLGGETGLELTKQDGNAQRWMDAVVPSLMAIHAHWLERRSTTPAVASRVPLRREAPKVGRNDASPCGSGQKFKKCCGGQSSTIH